ncbi:hypothetical protein E2562_038210 [Oryza meyeriana var. granulata]|uniref:non-specific serine/threonine protein kinase n=1 Tax=Oryza meyeriana var. granulata TaxID=110450 RepID=A0A6G1FGV8_9ORYZ|nr:hypothetical protein E2562_038210 [Oryza meyeriana var. granulata]
MGSTLQWAHVGYGPLTGRGVFNSTEDQGIVSLMNMTLVVAIIATMDERRTILMERYEIGRQLGQGNFAKVYFARNLTSGQAVAIKMIDKEKVTRVGLMVQIKREISIMRLVRHPNILQLFEVMASKSKIYFVLEYAKGGELFKKISKGKFSEDVARRYFHQLISGIDYCHSRGVYHRDLKPENLLLDENESLKVSDFGLSALSESKRHDGLLHTTCGTPAYVAPEVLSRRGYDERYGRREERFTTRQPAATIFAKLNELARRLKLKIKKKENGVVKLVAPKEGMKGFLELDTEIFELAPSFHLVEFRKSNGDTIEYQKLMKEDIRPALKDIVWAWQGGQHQQPEQFMQGEQQPSPLPSQQPQN